MLDRNKQISDVLNDLKILKMSTQDPNKLSAIDYNVAFFEACKSIFKYAVWLIIRAPKIKSDKIQEVNDLLPKYDEAMHQKLIEMEKKKFPGLIKLLVDKLVGEARMN